jgi:hypothetical protein
MKTIELLKKFKKKVDKDIVEENSKDKKDLLELQKILSSLDLDSFKNSNNINNFIKKITPADKILFVHRHQYPNASTVINTRQRKYASQWSEIIWSLAFEKLTESLQKKTYMKLHTIRDDDVVIGIFENGSQKTKTVDAGIAIESANPITNKKILIPLILAEDKTGHACGTTHSNFNGVSSQIRSSFNKAVNFLLTENNVSSGQTTIVDAYDSIDGTIQIRTGDKIDRKKMNPVPYYPIRTENINKFYTKMDEYFDSSKIEECAKIDLIPIKNGKFYRIQLKENGGVYFHDRLSQ